jgi:FMN phosphatase YigB (HAD superfamily)
MSSSELANIGMSMLPLEKVLGVSEEYETAFVASMVDTIVKFKDLKNASYVSKEVGLDTQFVKTLLNTDPFHCGLKESDLSKEQLEGLRAIAKGLLQNDKCIVANYAAFNGLKELLAKYKEDKRFVLAICTNTSYAKKQRAIVKQCGLDSYFDLTIVSSEVGIRKPNSEILGLIKSKYPQFKDYQICIIGDMIDRDILCGRNANVRTLWFTQKQFDAAVNYKKLKEIKPDFTFSQYAQLPGLLEIMLKDAEYLEGQTEDVQRNYRSLENYGKLPSQRLLKVAYYFPPLMEIDTIQRGGYAISNNRVLYYPYQVGCPIEIQPEFSVFIYHGTDIRRDGKFGDLLEAANTKKIALVNSFDSNELSGITDKLNEILANKSVIDLVSKKEMKVKVFSLSSMKENIEQVYRVTCIGSHIEILKQHLELEKTDSNKELLVDLTKTIGSLLGAHLLSIEFIINEAKGECYLVSSKSIYESKLEPMIEDKLNEFLEEHSKIVVSV